LIDPEMIEAFSMHDYPGMSHPSKKDTGYQLKSITVISKKPTIDPSDERRNPQW
jgi:hypothetical protein